MGLTDRQIERYSRQLMLEKVGHAGQKKLLDSKVLIIGAGGLGSAAGLYLAAAGIGTIGIVDADNVDITNLQRQIIHETGDLDALVIAFQFTVENRDAALLISFNFIVGYVHINAVI